MPLRRLTGQWAEPYPTSSDYLAGLGIRRFGKPILFVAMGFYPAFALCTNQLFRRVKVATARHAQCWHNFARVKVGFDSVRRLTSLSLFLAELSAWHWGLGAVIALIGFYVVNWQAKTPLVPLLHLPAKVIAVLAVGFSSGLLLAAGSIAVPQLLANLNGAAIAGLGVLPFFLTMVGGNLFCGQWMRKTGRVSLMLKLGLFGGALGVGGLALGWWYFLPLAGLGLGLILPAQNIAVQELTPRPYLTSSVPLLQLARALGGSVGAALSLTLPFVPVVIALVVSLIITIKFIGRLKL
jgi:hypothetical protein